MSILEGKSELLCPPTPNPRPEFSFLRLGNMFQKRRVSSPAPVTIFEPHGLIDRYKTL
jgi:hypothetical protein